MNRPYVNHPFAGLILAGGQSRRFGSDKALYKIDGRSLIEKAYHTVSKIADPVLISVAHTDQSYNLSAQHVSDVFKDSGPLGGLHAGLQAADSQWVFVAAVDMPFITERAIRLITDRIADGIEAVIAISQGRIQPLFGCYRVSLVASLEERLENNQLSATQFVEDIQAVFMDMPASILTNANRPEDLD